MKQPDMESQRLRELAARTGLLVLSLALVLGACSEETGNGPQRGDTGVAGDTGGRNPGRDSGGESDSGVSEFPQDAGDTGTGDTATEEADPEEEEPEDTTPIDPACDRDGDGYASIACGGDDCDDNNPRINPGAPEVCDEIDNNCDGQNNEGLDCTFYAHTPSELYRIDPFRKEATRVTSVPSDLFDFDTSRDGTLYGITATQLYRFDEANNRWDAIGSGLLLSGPSLNGFAIDSAGQAFATGGNGVYRVNLDTGVAQKVGDMGGGFKSSGDCVIDKGDTLYMSSSPTFAGADTLVRIDIWGDTVQANAIGNTGFEQIYGLTVAWGRMFGLTGTGELIEIDISTGRGVLIHIFPGKVWNGAASTADR